MSNFGSSWLVQRLKTPISLDNPFSFGGGLKNGGLSDEAMGLLGDIFSFGYMGAAEFEFGAVPEALNRIAKAKLAADQFELEGKTIYVLAPAEWIPEVEDRIIEFSNDYGDDFYQLKADTHLRDVLNDSKYTDRLGGWLELDNGFMFFVDQEMWAKTCDLFGVER